MLYNVVPVSTVQQSESTLPVHVYKSLRFWISFPFRSPESTKQSFQCYTVGSHYLVYFIHSINSEYMSIPMFQFIPPLSFPPLISNCLFLCLCQFFSRFHKYAFIYHILPGKSHGWRSLVGCNPWGC